MECQAIGGTGRRGVGPAGEHHTPRCPNFGSRLGCPSGVRIRGCGEDGSRLLPSRGRCHLLGLPGWGARKRE